MSHFRLLTCTPFVTSILIAFPLAYLMLVNGVSLCCHLNLLHSFGITRITFARIKPWGHYFHSDIVYILYKQMPWQHHDYIPVHFVAQNTWYWLHIRIIIIYKMSHVTTRRKLKIIKNNITNKFLSIKLSTYISYMPGLQKKFWIDIKLIMYVVALSSHFSASCTYNILSSITVGSANSYRQYKSYNRCVSDQFTYILYIVPDEQREL